MPVSMPLPELVEQSSSRERQYKTLSARFGNGYGQDIPDGINFIQDSWSVSYSNLTLDQRNAVMSALDTVGGWDYINWQPFGYTSSKKWKLRGNVKESTTGLVFSLSFNLEQIY